MTALFNPRASVDNVARPRTYDADLRAALVAALGSLVALIVAACGSSSMAKAAKSGD